jgi:hypothetical protein
LTLFDFTLEDDAGGEHALDISGLGLQQDRAEFPEGQIAPGETARGSVIFGIPETAPGPWVIHVQPVALVITGIEPGLLVIEGELQPFEVFGQ